VRSLYDLVLDLYIRIWPGHVGYRRLAYMMLDEGIVAVTPSSVYRVLKEEGLTSKWTSAGSASRRDFVQPTRPHEQWHTDIAYLNILGTHYFFIGVLDGYSRYIVHHEIRQDMSTLDVQVVIERALEKLPEGSIRPRIITDNGGPYVALEFKRYLREKKISHTRTRARHPQSNGKIERFHKSLKEECVRREAMGSLEEAKELIGRYVYEYNHHRLHAALNYLRPVDYLKGEKHVASLLEERTKKLEAGREARKKAWREAA
jgi:putative transposase